MEEVAVAAGEEKPVTLLLEQLRQLSFETDRRAAGREMRDVLARFDRLENPGGKQLARANAYRHILALDETGAPDPAAVAAVSLLAVIQVNELLLRTGRVDASTALVQAYHRTWPEYETLRTLNMMIAKGIGQPDGTFRDMAEKDVQVVRKAGAGATFIVFTGVNYAFGMSLNLLYHFWLSALNANVIFLRDREGLFFLGGVQSLGDEAATMDALRATIRELGAPRVATMGFSLGNFAALYYALKLQAQHAIAFAGPTSLDIGLRFRHKQNYPRAKALHDEGRLPWPDVKQMLTAAPDLRVQCFYSEENKADRLQGENLNGLPNVVVTPLPGDAHFTLEKLAEEERLPAILREAAGL